MPSYSDIPVELRPAYRRAPFGQWVSSLPVDPYIKKRILFLWSAANGEKWTREEVFNYAGI